MCSLFIIFCSMSLNSLWEKAFNVLTTQNTNRKILMHFQINCNRTILTWWKGIRWIVLARCQVSDHFIRVTQFVCDSWARDWNSYLRAHISKKIEWVSSCNNSIATNWAALKFSDFLEPGRIDNRSKKINSINICIHIYMYLEVYMLLARRQFAKCVASNFIWPATVYKKIPHYICARCDLSGLGLAVQHHVPRNPLTDSSGKDLMLTHWPGIRKRIWGRELSMQMHCPSDALKTDNNNNSRRCAHCNQSIEIV